MYVCMVGSNAVVPSFHSFVHFLHFCLPNPISFCFFHFLFSASSCVYTYVLLHSSRFPSLLSTSPNSSLPPHYCFIQSTLCLASFTEGIDLNLELSPHDQGVMGDLPIVLVRYDQRVSAALPHEPPMVTQGEHTGYQATHSDNAREHRMSFLQDGEDVWCEG